MNGNKRKNTAEQFYTLPRVALDFTTEVVGIYGKDAIYLEPCGGRGAFVDALLGLGVPAANVISFDIEPLHPHVAKLNFLEDEVSVPPGFIALTNPPYGRACSLASKFFNRCADLDAKAMAFLIPSSFHKVAISDRLDLAYKMRSFRKAPLVSYYTDANGTNERGRLSTEFQIWERSRQKRLKRKHMRHPWIEFVTWGEVRQGASYDFCIRTHGSGCGQILGKEHDGSLRRESGSGESHLNFRTVAFVRARHPDAVRVLGSMDYTRFSNAVSYIPCISPAEISILLAEVTGVPCFISKTSGADELDFEEDA
jgi:hypothetical protein